MASNNNGFNNKFNLPLIPKYEDIYDDFIQLNKFDDSKTRKFIQAQYKQADLFLKGTKRREEIQENVLKVWNHPKYSLLEFYGNYYFYTMNTGLQEQSVIYRQVNIFDGSEVLLDPNQLSKDGSIYLVYEDSAFSYNGKYFAYCLRETGSDWLKIRIRNTETKVDSPETLERVLFTRISWTHDEAGFFYSGYLDSPDDDWHQLHTLFYHRVGQPQSQDDMVLEFVGNPHWIVRGQVSHSGEKLIVDVNNVGFLKNRFYWADIKNAGSFEMFNLDFFPISLESFSKVEYVGDDDDRLLFNTSKRSRLGEILSYDVNTEVFKKFQAADDKYLQSFNPARSYALMHYTNTDFISCLSILITEEYRREKKNKVFDADIEAGTILSVSSTPKFPHFFVYLSTYTHYSMYFYDRATLFFPSLLRREYLKLPGACSKDFETTYRVVPTNGVLIKILEHEKFAACAWNERQPRPCLLNIQNIFHVEKGAELDPIPLLFAHLSNGFYVDAYIDCTYVIKFDYDNSPLRDLDEVISFLVDNKLTTREQLALTNSAQAAMVLATSITCDPSLCQAAIVNFGLTDHSSHEYSTDGDGYEPMKTGSSMVPPTFRTFSTVLPFIDEIEQSKAKHPFPALLVMVSESDGRLNTIPYKFVATLQKIAKKSRFEKRPILLKHFTGRDYSAPASTSAKIEQFTDILTFLIKTLK